MNRFILLIIIIAATSCSSKNDQPNQDLFDLRDRITQEYDRLDAQTLNAKIETAESLIQKWKDLRGELAAFSDTCKKRTITRDNGKEVLSSRDMYLLSEAIESRIHNLSLMTSINNQRNQQKQHGPITLSQAEASMRTRCESVGQILVNSKSVSFDQKTLYTFLSVSSESGEACISTISEFALEVISVDCGDYEEIISDWNTLR
jgi:hypothetical protein